MGLRPVSSPDPGQRPPGWLNPPLAVGLAAFLVYLNSLGNGFAYDDILIIVENPTVHRLGDLLRIWFTPYWPGPDAVTRGLYRPLAVFLYSVQWAISDGSPFLFHLVSVVLHAGVSILVYRLLRVLMDWRGGLAGALLFAVHPVHVEAVANVVGQSELLSALFSLTAAYSYASRPVGKEMSGFRFFLLPGLYLLAMLTKENAMTLPALFLALDVAQGRHRNPGYRSRAVATLVALGAVAVAYLFLRGIVLEGGITGSAAVDLRGLQDPGSRILTALSVWPEYLRLLFFPFHLSAMYDPATLPYLDSVTLAVVAGGCLLALVVATTLFLPIRPQVGLGSAWFILTILPVSNLLIPIGTLLGERTLYLPSVAVSIWVGYLVALPVETGRGAGPGVRGARHWASRAAIPGIGLAIMAFGVRSVFRNPVWRSNEVLFARTLRAHPENYRAQWFRARQLAEAGDSATSLRHWERAQEIYDGGSGFLTSFAQFQYRRGKVDEAEDLVEAALRIRPKAPEALLLQGLIEISMNRPSLARKTVEALRDLGFATMAEELADSLVAAKEDASHPGWLP